MNIPAFTAQASLYRTGNRYHTSFTKFDDSIHAQSVVAAFIPGPQTQHDCSVCTDACKIPRDICLGEVAAIVGEACLMSLGFGCGAAIAWGATQTASCYVPYEACLGYCNIPEGFEVGNVSTPHGPCCPKVCGPPEPWRGSGYGCCDHGETCKGLGFQENTRDGCCPVGRDCGNSCCAEGEKCCGEICCPQDYYCIDSHTCSPYPGTFGTPNTPPPTPPTPSTGSGCYLFEGGSPCGNKCCYGGLQCCGVNPTTGQPICQTRCDR